MRSLTKRLGTDLRDAFDEPEAPMMLVILRSNPNLWSHTSGGKEILSNGIIVPEIAKITNTVKSHPSSVSRGRGTISRSIVPVLVQ